MGNELTQEKLVEKVKSQLAEFDDTKAQSFGRLAIL